MEVRVEFAGDGATGCAATADESVVVAAAEDEGLSAARQAADHDIAPASNTASRKALQFSLPLPNQSLISSIERSYAAGTTTASEPEKKRSQSEPMADKLFPHRHGVSVFPPGVDESLC